MKTETAITIIAAVAASAFAIGRATAPPPRVEVIRSPTAGWVEVYQHGQLVGEYQPEDGEAYTMLADLAE